MLYSSTSQPCPPPTPSLVSNSPPIHHPISFLSISNVRLSPLYFLLHCHFLLLLLLLLLFQLLLLFHLLFSFSSFIHSFIHSGYFYSASYFPTFFCFTISRFFPSILLLDYFITPPTTLPPLYISLLLGYSSSCSIISWSFTVSSALFFCILKSHPH